MQSIETYIETLKDLHQPAYRAKQIVEAICKQGIVDYAQITVLPPALRKMLNDKLPILSIDPLKIATSTDGQTEKFLFELKDGQTVETVLMKFRDGRVSICLSCQTGCAMGCQFCATGTMRQLRNLTTEEIFDQVVYLSSRIKGKDREAKISNIVYMGMGEPFNNYQSVLGSIRMICSQEYLGFSPRRITVSTVGIIPGIERFADENLPVNLAVSLHSADQHLRQQIMPVATAYPLEQLLASVNRYAKKTGRRVSFEYVMLKDVNDRDDDAVKLSLISKSSLIHVNLIPYNATGLNHLTGSDRQRIEDFKLTLQKKGVNVTVRTSLGGDISAACGQLANN